MNLIMMNLMINLLKIKTVFQYYGFSNVGFVLDMHYKIHNIYVF